MCQNDLDQQNQRDKKTISDNHTDYEWIAKHRKTGNGLKLTHRDIEAVLVANINRRNLIIIGVVVLSIALSGFWLYSAERQREMLTTQTDRIQREVYLWSSHFQGLPQVIGRYPIVRDLLLEPTKDKQDAANFFRLWMTPLLMLKIFLEGFDKIN